MRYIYYMKTQTMMVRVYRSDHLNLVIQAKKKRTTLAEIIKEMTKQNKNPR